MLELNDDVLIHISSFLNDTDNCKLVRICTRINKILKKYGYIKHISTFQLDVWRVAEMLHKHHRTVLTLSMARVNSPQQFIIGKWPKKVYLHYCNGLGKIDPMFVTNTEELTIINHDVINNCKCIKINWEKFPNLKKLNVEVNNIELKGIGVCKNLKETRFKLYNR